MQIDYSTSAKSYRKLIKITEDRKPVNNHTVQETNQQSYNETFTDNINHVAIVATMLFCTGLERKRVQTNRE